MTQPTTLADGRPARRSGGAWQGLLWYGLLVPPFVWAVQLDLNYGLASHACFPDGAPRASFLSGWERIWVVLLVVNLVCAAICAVGLVASGQSWRRLRDQRVGPEQGSGWAYTTEERRRSFALCGLMVSGIFTAAVLFNTLYLWALSSCSLV